MEGDMVKEAVRQRYGEVARGEATCGSLCGCTENAEGLAITLHAEAVCKMVEVSGIAPPAGVEDLLAVNITATK